MTQEDAENVLREAGQAPDESFPLLNKVLARSEFDEKLKENPLNDRSRFFDFGVSSDGLVVTTC